MTAKIVDRWIEAFQPCSLARLPSLSHRGVRPRLELTHIPFKGKALRTTLVSPILLLAMWVGEGSGRRVAGGSWGPSPTMSFKA